jgi:heme-degrading monooxygenase HmoA
MFARVNEFKGSAVQLEDSLRDTEVISRKVDSMPGSLGMYYLVDRQAGKALAITLWDSADAMRASEAGAGQVREESTRAEGISVVSVGHYEVAANTVHAAATHSG